MVFRPGHKVPMYWRSHRQQKERFFVGGRVCKVCGVKYLKPKSYSLAGLRLCYVHRKEWFKECYQNYTKEWRRKHPEYKVVQYQVWKKWVVQNLERRRNIALRSYHKLKNNPKNKARKHIATKISQPDSAPPL